MSGMFNFGALAANVLNSLDNAAKDTLEEPRVSATALRSQRRGQSRQDYVSEDDEDNAADDSRMEADASEDDEPVVGLDPYWSHFLCLFNHFLHHLILQPTRPPLGNTLTRSRSTSSTGSGPVSSTVREVPLSPPKSSPRG